MLLDQKVNEDIGNGDFLTVKVPEYLKAGPTLTKEVGQEKYEPEGVTGYRWGRKQIEERQKRLADLAAVAWPLLVKK